MKSLKLLAAAALSAGLVAGVASTASAAIVCNAENECWHTHGAYTYHPEWGLVVHEDNWRWGHDDHYRWHEHAGRGYWHGGNWVKF